jgi:hypothetical protein
VTGVRAAVEAATLSRRRVVEMLASIVWGSLTLQLNIELCHDRRNQSCQSDGIDVLVGMADSETT